MDQPVIDQDQMDENINAKIAKGQFGDIMSKEQSLMERESEDENEEMKCNVNDATFISHSDNRNEERES